MEYQFASSIIGPVVSEIVGHWGAPGVVLAVALAAFIWWTKATSGVWAEKETTISRQDARIAAVGEERGRAMGSGEMWRESYYAVRFPGSHHEDVVAREGLDKE